MSNFLQYQIAITEKREAYANYNYASCKLKLAQVMERFAEVQSQHDPIASRFPNQDREALIDLVRYVVIGRFERTVNHDQR